VSAPIPASATSPTVSPLASTARVTRPFGVGFEPRNTGAEVEVHTLRPMAGREMLGKLWEDDPGHQEQLSL